MYAIVEIAGQQFKVKEKQQICVHRLEANEGDSITFDKVLLVDNEGSIQIGTPVVDGMLIKATVVDHVRGDKVIVFKKKRRKGYTVKNGHKQSFTRVKIESIA